MPVNSSGVSTCRPWSVSLDQRASICRTTSSLAVLSMYISFLWPGSWLYVFDKFDIRVFFRISSSWSAGSMAELGKPYGSTTFASTPTVALKGSDPKLLRGLTVTPAGPTNFSLSTPNDFGKVSTLQPFSSSSTESSSMPSVMNWWRMPLLPYPMLAWLLGLWRCCPITVCCSVLSSWCFNYCLRVLVKLFVIVGGLISPYSFSSFGLLDSVLT